MSEFKKYRRKSISELRPYIVGEELLLAGVSISKVDMDNGSPKKNDMIARNPKNHDDKWLVSAEYVKDNLEPLIGAEEEAPDNFLSRLEREQQQLNVKIQKLQAFLTGSVPANVSKLQVDLLHIQLSAMQAYNDCLILRLKNL